MAVTQKDCTMVAIITAVVFLSGVAGYMYMEKCQKNKECDDKPNEKEKEKKKEQSIIDEKRNEQSSMSTGNVELDKTLKKLELFSVFSPRTLPEIRKAIKKLNNILQQVKLAKEDDDMNYSKQKQRAEAENQIIKSQLSNLGLDIPSDVSATHIYEVNSEKVRKIAQKYLDDIKEEVKKRTQQS